jgi:quaternary ammonium compound-resistance protein SugE
MNPWLLLVVAGLLEVVWATTLKATEGWNRLWPSVGTLAAMIASFALLARAMQKLPAGTSYSVWVGIGAVVGTVILGAIVYKERVGIAQVICIALIVGGIVGLKLAAPDATGNAAPPAGS